jgi:arylsulfatase
MSIMSGQTVFKTGMAGNGSSSSVLSNRKTLPMAMRELGYQTLAVGKMHFTPQRARHGFDEMLLPDDYYRAMAASGSPLQPMRHGLGQNELFPSMATVPESMTLTSWIAEQCVNFIHYRRDPTMPFFIWCSFSKPHPPLDPPEPYYSMYRNCDIPAPYIGDWASDERCPESFKMMRRQWSLDQIKPEVIREARAAYYGLITQIDYNMGRIFAALQDQRIYGDTLIVYCSDHGEYLGDHHSGSKVHFHESSAHVPFAIRLPRSWETNLEGTVSDALATHADIMPTLIGAAGGTPPPECDGIDLLAVARGEAKPREYLDATAREMYSGPGWNYFGITDGRWKYIFFPIGGTEQLFDLETDPHELHDLSAESKFDAERTRLRDELIRRLQSRNIDAVKDGKLVTLPVPNTDPRLLRRNAWPGYHTERVDADVRH